MATDFLERVNAAYQAGVKVIQGHRTAKNRETSFAFLDALNEEIGNSIFRRGHRALGFSSATIGSAMAFEFPYYRHLMLDVFDTAGEDKVMELKILKEKRIIHYLDKAVVYDEKVSTGQNFSTQRKRWVAVQLEILASHWKDGVRQLFMAGNLDYFDKVFQLFLIPKVILIGLLAILGALAVFGVLQPAWVGLAILYYTALLLAVPGRFYTWQLLQAIGSLPMAIIYMFRSIIGLRPSGSSKFEVTKKTKQ
ncbi:MAG: glycosyltransferase family 2 protein [Owenweeksia sp.]|nr:glycosyltransferase family 2 protein [Owenweeksia sp.]